MTTDTRSRNLRPFTTLLLLFACLLAGVAQEPGDSAPLALVRAPEAETPLQLQADGWSAGWAQDPAVFRTESRLVEVYAAVEQGDGRRLSNLSKEQFQVADNGQPVQIRVFEGHGSAVTLAVLMDVTGSMQKDLPAVKNAINHLVDQLADQDHVSIYGFSTRMLTLQNFTTDKRSAKNAVLQAQAGGKTALFDAISQASRNLQQRLGRKALVVFTDSKDNASVLNAASASRLAKRSGVPVYLVGAGEALSDRATIHNMEDLARATGGRAFECRRRKDIDDIFADISSEIQNTYLLGYEPPPAAGVAWRSIEVSLPGLKQARIRARQGYYPR
jgi:VWFA-related protein